MFKEIIVSRSVEVFIQNGFPDQWLKAGGVVTIKEGDNELEVFDKAYDVLDEVLQKQVKKISPELLEVGRQVADSPERIAFRKKIAKCETLSNLNTFSKEARHKKCLDIYNEISAKLKNK